MEEREYALKQMSDEHLNRAQSICIIGSNNYPNRPSLRYSPAFALEALTLLLVLKRLGVPVYKDMRNYLVETLYKMHKPRNVVESILALEGNSSR